MPEDSNEKLPQNIQRLLMEIGERMVLFRLFLLVKDTEWDVYQNLSESGCDLLLYKLKGTWQYSRILAKVPFSLLESK